MSRYDGHTRVEIGGVTLHLVYDWAALGRVRDELGADGQARALTGDVDTLAALAEIGLARNHPHWTAADIKAASPPVMPLVQAIDRALAAAYFGPGGRPDEDAPENPPSRTATRSSWLFERLIGRASRRPSSGG